MTRDAFLADPLNFLLQAARPTNIAPEWLLHAWTDSAEFRETILSFLIDNIKKFGSLKDTTAWTSLLSSFLPCDEVNRLYLRLRDGVERSETEWRHDFICAFPNCQDTLPQIDRERVRYIDSVTLFRTMKLRNLNELTSVLAIIQSHDISLSEIRLPILEIMNVVYFPCFDSAEDTDVWSALRVAEFAGLSDHARLLRASGAEQDW